MIELLLPLVITVVVVDSVGRLHIVFLSNTDGRCISFSTDSLFYSLSFLVLICARHHMNIVMPVCGRMAVLHSLSYWFVPIVSPGSSRFGGLTCCIRQGIIAGLELFDWKKPRSTM